MAISVIRPTARGALLAVVAEGTVDVVEWWLAVVAEGIVDVVVRWLRWRMVPDSLMQVWMVAAVYRPWLDRGLTS